MRFILTARRLRQDGAGIVTPCPTQYLSRGGIALTFNASRAAIFKSSKDAADELEYRRRIAPVYDWAIERLPARMALERAVLFAVEIA